MAFQAHFFFQIWKTFLQESGYKEGRYFISRESFDIATILINGLTSLILIYCDYRHLSGDAVDLLLPWLHSTEPTEHTFGETHHICNDFTFLDFLHLT